MTEEIIINDVNVAGCKYLNKVVNEEPYCNIDEEHLYTCSSDNNCYYKQFKRLQETLKHTENGRKQKANKLKRIEEIVTHCIQGGFTDEFVQEIFDICREYEEV